MYITIEGIDTAGKSTQIEALKKLFTDAIFVKEPGETEIGNKIRSIILDDGVESSRAETLLFLADRALLVDRVIKPNIQKLIISDRSAVSGIAYSLASYDFDTVELVELNRFATDNILPDLCIVLKLEPSELSLRLQSRPTDKIESRGEKYLLNIQKNLFRASELLGIQTVSIDASLPMKNITQTIGNIIKGES